MPSSARPALAIDLERQALDALDAARAQAEALVAETRQELAAAIRLAADAAAARARGEGYEEGLRQGRAAGRREVTELREAVAALNKSAQEMLSAREAVKAEAEDALVELAVAIGSKLAARELRVRPGAARDRIIDAIGLLADRVEVRVMVNPEEVDLLEEVRDVFREEFPDIVRISIEPDPSVPRGGAKARTARGRADATVEGRSRKIAELLLGPDGRSA